MKKLAIQASLGIALAVGGSAAYAQYGEEEAKPDRRFYISPMATYHLYDDARTFDDEQSYSLSLGKVLGRGTNMELYGNFSEPGFEDGADPAGELESYGVTFLLFQWRDTFPLYTIVGLGKGKTLAEGSDVEIDSDQFDFGFGYMLGLGSWPLVGNGPALRLEARYRFDKYSRSQAQLYSQEFGTAANRSQHDTVVGLGLYLPIGADPNRPEPQEPEPIRIVEAAVDTDGDQIPDDQDACPGTPPGVAIDVRGCERDDDKDGVANSKDRCPATALGQQVGPNGCPPDGDKDGVLNAADQCPNTPAGKAVMADGCALTGDCRIPGAGQRIDANGCAVGSVVLKGVNFENGSTELTVLAEGILNQVAKALRGASQARVEVGGHTDSVGRASGNQRLSENRARSVKNYLESQGVARGVLSIKGYGESQPLADNSSAEGRAANRRVELKVLD